MFEPRVRSCGEFLAAEVDPPEFILEPWLPVHGLAMVSGPTGVGKTMFALAVAIAIASGGDVLGWRARKPRRVLYVDGEMSMQDMQQRVRALVAGMDVDPELVNANLFLCSDADQDSSLPKLTESGMRKALVRKMEELGIELLVLDNLSALCNSDIENDVESWTAMQDWLLALRHDGYSVLMLHHAGKARMNPKSGKSYYQQRGTSKREDVLNTCILLVPAADDVRAGHEAFQVIFTKHRAFVPSGKLVGCIIADPEMTTCKIDFPPITRKAKRLGEH